MIKYALWYVLFLTSQVVAMDQPQQVIAQEQEIPFPKLLEKADAGDADAQYVVAERYQFGREGAGRSLERAMHYFDQAMSRGHVYAAQRKGHLLLDARNYQEAQTCFERAAQDHEHLSIYELARKHHPKGWGTNKLLSEEIKWLEKMIEETSPARQLIDAEYHKVVKKLKAKAAYRLAEIHNASEDTVAAKDRAIELCRQAIYFNPASVEAKALLGKLCPSMEIIRLLMTNVASEAHAPTQCLIGKKAYEEKRYPEAVDCFRKVVADAEAQFYLGLCCFGGLGTPKDEENALAYWRASAEQGYAPAFEKLRERHSRPGVQCVLGKLYRLGKGVPADAQTALAYYKNSLEGGCPEAEEELKEFAKTYPQAAYLLGNFYENTDTAGLLRAISFYEKAALAQHAPSMAALEAFAERNELAAFLALSRIFETDGTPLKNYYKSRRWLIAAVEAGFGEAAFFLALKHRHGTYGSVDMQESMEWCVRSAELKWSGALPLIQEEIRKDTPAAYYAMGLLCQKQLAKDVEPQSPSHWLKIAAEKRYGPAYMRLAEIRETSPLKSFQSVADFMRCYQEMAEYYEGAKLCGIAEGLQEGKRIKEIVEGMEEVILLRREKSLGDILFTNVLFQKVRDSFPQEASPEVCFWAAHICCVVSQLSNPLIQDAVAGCLQNIAKFGRKDRLALSLLRRLSAMVLGPEFINNPLQVTMESFRLTGLINVCLGTAALQNNLKIELSKQTFRRSTSALRDVLISIFNNNIFGEKKGNDEEYRLAQAALLTQFSSMKNVMKRELLWDQDLQKLGNVLSLRTFLAYSPTDRFKQRIIKLQRYITERVGANAALLPLSTWARMGLNCDISVDRETEAFIRQYATDEEGLTVEGLGLEMRIAICLAEARKKAIESLVPEIEVNRELLIWYLEKKACSLLALLGDAQPLNDRFMQYIPQVYKDMGPQMIVNHVLGHYNEVAALLEESKKTKGCRITRHVVGAYFERNMGYEKAKELMSVLYTYDESKSRNERYELTERGAQLLLYCFGYFE